MKRDGHEKVQFFTGTEIELTPAANKHTLFVVGLQDVDQIMWQIGEADRRSKHPITHVYFGANMSFPNPNINDAETWGAWESMINAVLDRGYWCTLDLDVTAAEGLCEGSLVDNALFIPMISVKLPYIKQLGYNATLKLDDKDFNKTNPGVWCHSVHDLMNRDHFTSWDLYKNDKTV